MSPASNKGSKVKCPECGKKYSDSMALEYHKITFHVTDTESKLFSASLYSEQMNFDKNFLKISDSNDIPSPLPSATKSTSENANRKSNTNNSISKSKQMKSMPDKFKKSVSKAVENETSKKVSVKGSKANHPAVKKVTTLKAESKPVENPLKTFLAGQMESFASGFFVLSPLFLGFGIGFWEARLRVRI